MVLLVGNKGDLIRSGSGSEGEHGHEGEGRGVLGEEARAWVEEEGLAGYVETSAKDGTGVEEVRSISPLPSYLPSLLVWFRRRKLTRRSGIQTHRRSTR